MGGLRGRLRTLEREMDETLVVVEYEDGTTSRFRDEELFPECFLHETGRWRRAFRGADPGEAHPFTVALRTATNLEALVSEQGTMILHFLGEDEIIRGARERSGAGPRENPL